MVNVRYIVGQLLEFNMSHFLFNGNVPVVCERPDWRKCPEHKHLTNVPPINYAKSNSVPFEDIIEEQGYLSRSKLGETVVSEEEFLKLAENGEFTLRVGLDTNETLGADYDRFYFIFGEMIGGNLFSRDDSVTFSRAGYEDGMVLFDVKYEYKAFAPKG